MVGLLLLFCCFVFCFNWGWFCLGIWRFDLECVHGSLVCLFFFLCWVCKRCFVGFVLTYCFTWFLGLLFVYCLLLIELKALLLLCLFCCFQFNVCVFILVNCLRFLLNCTHKCFVAFRLIILSSICVKLSVVYFWCELYDSFIFVCCFNWKLFVFECCFN